MPGSIKDIAKRLERVQKSADESSNSMSSMRQLSHAVVVSVAKDYGKCDIVLAKNGKGIQGAIISMHPNDLNILGYPRVGDSVLVYHQRDFQDCHVLIRLHDKTKIFYKYNTYTNNCTVPAGALAG